MPITFDLSDELTRKVARYEAEIPRILELGIREWQARGETGYSGLSGILEKLAALPSAEEVLQLRPAPALQERIEKLLEEIRRQIKQSREMVVLLTPHSVTRQWVILEVGAAWCWSKRLRILFVMCHVSVDPLPEMIKTKKAIQLNDFDQYTQELADRLRGYHD